MALVADTISVRYEHAEAPALARVSVCVEAGGVLGVCGCSGSGKTTLLGALAGTLPLETGCVTAEGMSSAGDLSGSAPSDESDADQRVSCSWRAMVALVGQMPERQLFAKTAFEDVAFGPRNAGLSEEEVRERVQRALERVGLDPNRARHQSPFSYSGGEQRALALAGMLALEPRYLLLDEPTAGFDAPQTARVTRLVEQLAHEGRGIVVVSHDLELLGRVADDALVLREGHAVVQGRAREVLGSSDMLQRAGLSPTVSCELAARLRARGADISPCVTPEDLACEVARLRAAEGGAR